MRNESSVSYIQKKWHNPQYLTSVSFKAGTLLPTTDINHLFKQCSIIIICVPSAYLLPVLQALPGNAFADKQIVSAVKGIIPEVYELLNDYLKTTFSITHEQYVAITGPCHAEEVAQERLSYLTFSGLDDSLTKQIAHKFTTDYIRTTVNHDLWGAQYAAVLKKYLRRRGTYSPRPWLWR